MLSQAEIDALLSGDTESNELKNDQETPTENQLTPEEIDALGEIGNISMGTSATTLHSLLGQKVSITTPKVEVVSWEDLYEQYKNLYVATKVEYVNGLHGSNLMLLKEKDTKIIADLMMGGDGSNVDKEEISDIHISAISEAMNQMIGSAATSMSSVFNKRIDISPPKAYSLKIESSTPDSAFESSGNVVKVSFKMVVGEIIDSEIMQLIPINFAREMVASLLKANAEEEEALQKQLSQEGHEQLRQELPQQEGYKEPQQQLSQGQQYQGTQQQASQEQQYYGSSQQAYMHQSGNGDFLGSGKVNEAVNVQPASFEKFDEDLISFEKKNISLIMDVPLEVTVELGRTKKYIKEILEFSPGSIIELDKLAGDPVDILVNGKIIAKGEVVVIDENFGVRITDIINPSKRI